MNNQHQVDSDLTEAIRILYAFIDTMNQWELKADEDYDRQNRGEIAPEEFKKLLVNRLQDIQRSFCEGNAPLKRSEPGGLSWGQGAPEYDRAKEAIKSVTRRGKLITIHTNYAGQFGNSPMEMVYQLVLADQGWRIRDNRKYVTEDGKLEPWDL